MATEPAAPALATSKRKFYKLLDGLNSSTNVKTNKSSSTATTSDEPFTKRTRISMDSHSLSRPSSVHVVGSQVVTKIANGAVLKAPLEPRKTPNYQPYSQDRFLARLRTFADVKVWTYKPTEISEVEWAKRGWVCDTTKVDTVACKSGCEARVVIRLERGRERAKTLDSIESKDDGTEESSTSVTEEVVDWHGEPDDELVKRYRALIVDGHRDGCLWRIGGCKDDIYRIRMADAGVWRRDLIERYQSLLTIKSSLPERLKLPESDESHSNHDIQGQSSTTSSSPIDNLESDLTSILASASTIPSDEPDSERPREVLLNMTAATLAVFGWHGSSPHNIHLATCDRCFQRIGLWLYTSNPANKALPSTQSGIPDDDILRFDVKDLHREYCPWVNADSQAGLESFNNLSGWEVLKELVKSSRLRDRNGRKSFESFNGAEEGLEEDPITLKSTTQLDKEDRERESRLAKLKRVFTVRKTDKAGNRKSWHSSKGG